ncbi:MAG: universal stress protein [Lewinellaceae bacterium]|nr:universal stress protein [Lewinellaceae bacterium]
MKKILVPVDFSDNSKHALRIGAAIAVKYGALLEVIHVNTAIAYAPAMPEYPGLGSFDMTEYYDTVADEFRQLKKNWSPTPHLPVFRSKQGWKKGCCTARCGASPKKTRSG